MECFELAVPPNHVLCVHFHITDNVRHFLQSRGFVLESFRCNKLYVKTACSRSPAVVTSPYE